jgi:ribulose-phosphate 3-epimerase
MTNRLKTVRKRGMTTPRISASLMAADGARLGDACREAAALGVNSLHWDIMDGHFVPNLTFGPATVKACRAVSKMEFDVHLMVADPARWIDLFAQAGADYISVHVELGTTVPALLAQIKKAGCKSGLAVNPGTNLETVDKTIWPMLDRLLLMSVNPGFGGQEFIDVTEKISQAAVLCREFPKMDIAVDGGINGKTAPSVIKAGAMNLISGSGLFENGMPSKAKLDGLRGGGA